MRAPTVIALACAGLLALTAVGGVTVAAFTATTSNPASSLSAAPDFVAPALGASTTARSSNGTAQHIHPGSTYHLYAQITDTGNPASGTAGVTADVSALTGGQTGALLSAGSFSFGGIAYNHRSGPLTADATLASCSYTPTVTPTDDAGNGRTENAAKVMIDRDLLDEYNLRIDGAGAGDEVGVAVAGAGDVNGDARPDALIGAYQADNNGRTNSGSAYVVFGQATPSTVDLAALGTRGYRIDGAAGSNDTAYSVANVGDVNGDGRPDALIGADLADNNGRLNSGSAYVVFGKATTATVDLAALGTQGYRIDGAAAAANAGYAVANAGDVDGDGAPDLLIAAPGADNNGRGDSGSVYVVFGQAGTTTIDLAALGTRGYRIDGAAAGVLTGLWVAEGGDVNGDGRPDALIGGPYADNNGRGDSGSAYVVFGQATTTTIDLAALGTRGYRIDGAAAGDTTYTTAGAGDVNGDGRPDALIGALAADNNGRPSSGSVYVVFGQAGTTTIDLAALGTRGYRIDGAAAGDTAGGVGNAGDLNGDGRPDALVGAPGADGNGRTDSGSVYVVFGQAGTTGVDLAALGTRGYRIDGAAAGDATGVSAVPAGDVTGDGRPDLLIGAHSADGNGRTGSGSAYVFPSPACG